MYTIYSKRVIFFFSLFVVFFKVSGQELSRQALIDFSIRTVPGSANPVIVNEINEQSAFYKAGLRKDDQILAINNLSISDVVTYYKGIRRLRGNKQSVVRVMRGNDTHEINCLPLARPLEEIKGCETTYDKATTPNGYDVRMIITKPLKSTGKKPVLFFVQWLSCDQVELDRNNMDGWAFLIEELASKGDYILVRTEKPGLGDSNGPDCFECDLQQDIDAYKAGFKKMLSYDFVDKNNIILVGGSIGGALVPIVAENQNVKAIISTGGFSTTWYEHILDFERTRLFFSGTEAEKIDPLVKKFTSFYYQYLIEKKKPTEIIKADTSFKSIWYQSGDMQFGRPAKYYQQLQDLNMSYYWNKVNCPVLVLYGEYDWIMSRAEQENIIQFLNKKHPGLAELKVIPGMNHHFSKYSSPAEAFDEPFIKYEPAGYKEMMKWLETKITR
ncbi:MAG TPA: alpha/beta fold hydrolase [Chitinophagaceae bacterium]|nr:alpha/beta fold hydrolase [Chitinophagaceae bacterium]